MMQIDHAALADALLPAVLRAGQIEMHHLKAGVESEIKSDSSPVTIADREAEAVLIQGLWRAASGVPVVAEESASMGQLPAPGRSFFVVDPLDGTRDYVTGTGEFTVNIGLISDGVPIFGMVYAPAFSHLCVTIAPGVAVETFVSPDAGLTSFSNCQVQTLKTREPDEDKLIVLESRSHRSAGTDAYLAGYHVAELKRSGSSRKFCLIARGEADFYPRLGPTKEWDTAAGHAILKAAGGTVTRLSGTELTYGKSDMAYLNPHFVAWARGPIAARKIAV